MKYSHVNIKEISGAKKLSPEYYLNKGKLRLSRCRRNNGTDGNLSDYVLNVFRPGIFKRIFINNPLHGIEYITASDMMNYDPISWSKLLSVKMTANMDSMKMEENSILLSCAGTIGNVRFIDKRMSNKIASQDIIRVIPKTENCGFIYAYVSSPTIREYLQSLLYGGVVQRIEPKEVENIPMVKFNNETIIYIDNLIRSAASLRDQANELLDKAKRLLMDYIGEQFSKSNGYKTARTSITDIRQSLKMRLDPPVFINDGVEMLQRLSDKTKPLGECNAVVRRPGIFKRSYVSNGLPYIKGSEIFNINPFTRCEQLSKTRTPMQEEMTLKDGQILVTCAGSVGAVKLITKEYEDKDAIGSQDIIRIEANDKLFTSEYLYAYLSLPMLFDYMQSMKYGAVIERVEPFHIASIPVIIPTIELSEAITALIKEYKDCTYKAFCNEERAIYMVETEIESWNHKPTKK